MEKIKNTKFQIRLPIILTIGLAAGIMIGATFAGSDKSSSDFMKGVMKFREVMGLIDRSYVDDVNTDKMVENAVTKMLENLDPHTVYVSAKDVLCFRDKAFVEYCSSPQYQTMIEKTFGKETLQHVQAMLTSRIPRKILS